MKSLLFRLLFFLYLSNATLSHEVTAQHSITTLQTAQTPNVSNLVIKINPRIDTFDIEPSHIAYDKNRVPLPGRSVSFNGTNQDIIGSNAALAPLDFNTPFTVSARVKTVFNNTIVQTIFAKWFPTGNQNGFSLVILGDGSIQVGMFSNVVSNIGISVKFSTINGITYPVSNNRYNNVCATYDGSGLASGFKVYINGNAMDPIVQSTTAPGASSAFTTNNWRVGSVHSASNWFKGDMFDVRLYYGVAKSPTEVASIFLGNLEATGLVFKYNLDENSGTTAYNSYKTSAAISANGQTVANGTLQNAPTRSTQGVNGGVYSFQNTIGYTLSGSVYIPKNEGVAGYFDASGAALQYRDPVRHRIRITHGVKDTINFNPYNAPLSATVSSTFVNPSFVVPPSLPTKFVMNSSDTTFAWGSVKDPLYVDRSTGVETNFLVYRNFNTTVGSSTDQIGQILNYIQKPTPVFILIGQSNGQGNENAATLLPGLGYSTVVTNAFIWNIINSYVQHLAPQTSISFANSSQVGPDISLATDLVKALKTRVFIIKYCQGSTSLDSNASFAYWKPSVLNGHGDASKLYPGFKSTAKAALAAFSSNRIITPVLIWDQGENDCNATNSAVYGANLKLLINQARLDLGYPNMPVVVRLLSDQQTSLTSTYRIAIVNAVIDLATNPASANYVTNVTTINTNGTSYPVTAGNNIHFTTAGQVLIGQNEASAIIANKLMK